MIGALTQITDPENPGKLSSRCRNVYLIQAFHEGLAKWIYLSWSDCFPLSSFYVFSQEIRQKRWEYKLCFNVFVSSSSHQRYHTSTRYRRKAVPVYNLFLSSLNCVILTAFSFLFFYYTSSYSSHLTSHIGKFSQKLLYFLFFKPVCRFEVSWIVNQLILHIRG